MVPGEEKRGLRHNPRHNPGLATQVKGPRERKTPPLAVWGEYLSRDPESSEEVYRARRLLLDTVTRVYPRLGRALSTDVFPLYDRLAKKRKLAKEGYDFEKVLWSDKPFEALTEAGGLKAALCRWATRFNVTADWLMVEALRTLQGWCDAPDWREALQWNTIHGRSGSPVIGEPFEFHYPGWEVQLLPWWVPAPAPDPEERPQLRGYCNLLRKCFENALAEYEKKTRELAESRGLVRARGKYSPANFEWFALYQFAGMSSKQIADCYAEPKYKYPDDSTVLRGIKAAAKLIDWGRLRKPGNRKIL